MRKYIITGDDDTLQLLKTMMRRCANNYDEIALDYCAAGCTCEALKLWSIAIEEGALTPMTYYYMGWCNAATDAETAKELFAKAEAYPSDYCFPTPRSRARAKLRHGISAPGIQGTLLSGLPLLRQAAV